MSDNNLPADIPVFDITSVNLVELGKQLKETLHTKRPASIFFKKRHNEKAILDVEYQKAIVAQIEDLIEMNSALLTLNADVYLTQERLGRIIQRYREQENFIDEEGYRLAERAEKTHRDDMQALEDNAVIRTQTVEAVILENERKQEELTMLRAQINAQAEKHEKEVEALELENKRRMGEVALLKAQEENLVAEHQKENIKMDFMRKVIETIDLNELPDYLRTFVINSIFNPSQQITSEMQLMDKLEEFVVRKSKAEARQQEAEAVDRESQADISRTTANKTMYDFDELKKGKEN